ncbi:MAG: hypothetical protein U0Q16_26170 [Bryobacteraceae bacterium]
MTNSIFLLVIATSAPEASGAGSALLDRAGERVRKFWDEMYSVTCVEHIRQEKFNDKRRVVLRADAQNDYLLSMRWNAGELLVDEARTELGPPPKKHPKGSLLATRGFATLLLVLHPEFQPHYHFSVRPVLDMDRSGLVPVDFVPRAGGKTPGVLELKGREYPIAWQGTAWIDSSTGTIARVEARWKEPPEEIGLARLASDVRYGPVKLRTQTYWLPQSAHVELETRHQIWKNEHRFDGYRLFSVETETKIEERK